MACIIFKSKLKSPLQLNSSPHVMEFMAIDTQFMMNVRLVPTNPVTTDEHPSQRSMFQKNSQLLQSLC